MKDNIFRKNH